ncbi:MAG: thiolase family protein [Proteobacteria bacterium]|nr:thiolase family protein [Pseudomonadota bacterium]
MAHFEKSPRDAVVVSAVRTAIGKGKRGTLAQTRPDDLMGAVIKAAVARVDGLEAASIDDVIVGTATPEAEQGLNVARVALDLAGLPDSVPGQTINRFCSSGIQAIADGAQAIMAGWADTIVAGGVESMSLLPMGGHHPMPNPSLVDSHPEAYAPMGLTAELVADQFGISREDQDAFALSSHAKALAAQADGKFDDEIVPVTATVFKGGQRVEVEFSKDEGPRAGSDMAAMAKLRTPFKMGGSVTAGTSSQVSDGAAASVIMSRERAEELGVEILGTLRMYQVVGVPPEIMGVGPLYAIPKALERAGLTLDDIDVFEVNEAFASQALYCARELGIPDEKLNPNGGAIALGHPLGCTGARMTATLLSEMKRTDAKLGVVSMCIGGGMGAAAIFERE